MQYLCMNSNFRFLIPGALLILSQAASAAGAATAKAPSMPEVLKASSPADWRPLDPNNTIYVDLPTGRVVIELAPAFAPLHVVNIKTLARAGYFDGLSVIREQDNYVAQWGDPDNRHPLPPGIGKVAPEFDSALPAQMAFTKLPDGDVYAPEVGFSNGFPVARSSALHKVWLAHCYGMVGVGRDLDAQSGSGAELYVVIGHSPRHLDRNVALVGRVLKGRSLEVKNKIGGQELGVKAGSRGSGAKVWATGNSFMESVSKKRRTEIGRGWPNVVKQRLSLPPILHISFFFSRSSQCVDTDHTTLYSFATKSIIQNHQPG